jgi:periplasmic divalent cation tolerance protein
MQNPIPLAVFYVTASNREEASKLSAILVEKKLIACCNIFDNVTSVYEWQGKMENSQ